MSYWDTSALAKLYLPEPDSTIFQTHASRTQSLIFTATLTLLELRRVAFRKEMEQAIQFGTAELVWQKADADANAKHILLVEFDKLIVPEVDQVLRKCYRNPSPVPIRTLDAIHLASALIAQQAEIVATDRRLREAATLFGFSVYPS